MTTSPPFIDLHEDLALYYQWWGIDEALASLDEDAKGRHTDLPKYRRANVRLVFASVFPGTPSAGPRPETLYAPSIERVWDQVRTYYRLAQRYGLVIVRGRDDLARLFTGEWRLGLLLHLEGADVVRDPETDLRLLYELGFRSIGLTWNPSNHLASGCCDGTDYGLTEAGRCLVEAATRLGMVVDLAHASKRAVLEAAEAAKAPLVVSHTCLRRFVDRPRNIDDEAAQAVARTGGVIGITFIPDLLRRNGEASIDDVADQIAYLRDLVGVDAVAIGTDYHGIPGRRPPRGLESIDRITLLWAKLEERGFTRKEIEAIAYRNALRVLERVLRG